MKQNINQSETTIQNTLSIIMGCPKTDNQISIVEFWLKKIQMETFTFNKMEELLQLFVTIYLKCP